MYQIDTSTTTPTLPTPAAVGDPGYFTGGNPGTGLAATVVSADWLNMVQSELINLVTAADLSPSKTTFTQVLQAIQALIGGSTRTRLTGNLDLYVSTSGSDSNYGLTSDAAFATIQHAVNVATNNYDTQNYNITINVGNGTYSSGCQLTERLFGNGELYIVGNTGSPSSCTINCTSGVCFSTVYGAFMNVAGFTLASPNGTNIDNPGLCLSSSGSWLFFSDVIFEAAQYSHIEASNSGIVYATGNYTIAAGSQTHIVAGGAAGVVSLNGATITLTGTPAFSQEFALADSGGLIYAPSAYTTFSGSATGARYQATNGGCIDTGGGGANFFPGSTAGSNASGYYE